MQLKPDLTEAHNNLATALYQQGAPAEAMAHYHRALALDPNFAEAYNGLGVALADQGRLAEAMACYRRALEVRPLYAKAHDNLGLALCEQGALDEAIVHFQKALEIWPSRAEVHQHLGVALYRTRRTGEALAQWREFLRLRPRDLAMLNQTAWILATAPEASTRSGAEAVALAQQAARLSSGQDPTVLDTLAAAYAEAGRFTEAVETARQAHALAVRQQNTALADKIQARIQRYAEKMPYRDPR